MKKILMPDENEIINSLNVGDRVLISGKIYCGRDSVLPKICKLISQNRLDEFGIDLFGSVIFHTAVSVAGVGPTSSNKPELEGTMNIFAKAGVKMFLGKGAINKKTIKMLNDNNAVYAIIPPVTALLKEKTISTKCIAFSELGMEAFYELEVKDYPAIIGASKNFSIYKCNEDCE